MTDQPQNHPDRARAEGTQKKRLGPVFGRRTLLQLAGVSTAAVAAGIHAPASAQSSLSSGSAGAGDLPDGELFGLGVASGTPGPTSMILWTRLAPDPLAEDGHGGMTGGDVLVHWEVARDREFTAPVAEGDALAQRALAHSVHPEVTGLDSATEYFYRFSVAGRTSPVGRFRTLPAAGDRVDAFTFAVASCQAWYHGYFTPWKHLVEEPDLDLILFVGDYIYEYAIVEGDNLWRQGASVPAAFETKVETLEQYRLRYSLFKTDPHLMAAHARAAMTVTWDDHEVENNYAGDWSDTGVPTEHFLYQKAAAYRAYYENLPVAPEALPEGPDNRIYTGFEVGDLISFHILDTRQYRDPVAASEDPDAGETASMLGAEQGQWLIERLGQSRAQWNILVNSVTVASIADSTDQWDGYPGARRQLMDQLAGVSDPVVLTGDIHQHCAAELWADPNASERDSEPVAVELIATSVASDGDGAAGSESSQWLRHPYVKAMDRRRGYIRVDVNRDQLDSEFVVVPWIERDDTAPRETAFRYRTRSGEHRLNEF